MTVKRNLFLWRYLFWASGEHSENEPVRFDFNNGISNTGFCSSLLNFFLSLKIKEMAFHLPHVLLLQQDMFAITVLHWPRLYFAVNSL